MMKRILSGLLALLLVISILPASVFAEDAAEPCVTCGNVECTCEAEAETCPTCGQENCESQHLTWCEVCKVDDCGQPHLTVADVDTCETCGNEVCTCEEETYEPCATCGSTECGGNHENWCANCKKDNCGVDHTAPKSCATCGSTECDGSHENWCANCKKDNCGVDHTRIPETSTGPKNVGEKNHPMVGKIVKLTAQAQYPTAIEDPNNAFNTGSLIRAEAYPEHMEIEAVITVGSTVYYQLKAATGYTWPDYVMDLNAGTTKNFAHYWIKSDSVEEVQPEAPAEAEQSEVTLEKTTESGQKISMTGVVPQGTRLSAQDVTMAATYASARSETRILATLDIKLLDADGKEYQPYTDDNFVQITLDAAEMGLSDGDVVKLTHMHEDDITVLEPFVVVDGKITFYTDRFSIWQVESTIATSGNQITSGSTYTMTVGEPAKIFYSSGSTKSEYENSSYYQKYYVWSVTDTNNVINYTVTNLDSNYWGTTNQNYDARVAPWIMVEAKRSGRVTLTMSTYYQSWSRDAYGTDSHGQAIFGGSESFDILVVAPEEFHIENEIPENGCLVPVGLEGVSGAIYTWTRSDHVLVRPEALSGNSVNVSIDRGGVIEGGTPITYTVKVTDKDGALLGTDSYQILYGSEILNRSFETPAGASKNWDVSWANPYGYATNGTPGLYWKTTAPGTKHNIGRDIEFGDGSGPHGAVSADGDQYVEINAEEFGCLYQDLLTTPGATLSWSFSHTARTAENAVNGMYIIMGASKTAQTIINRTNIDAIIDAALATAGSNTITNSGSGFEFTYDHGELGTGTYRIWYNYADSTAKTVDAWEKVSGKYTVPDGQYLTRLFFATDTNVIKNDNTLGNLIDGVIAREVMDTVIMYYEDDDLREDDTEYGSDLRPNTTQQLENLQKYLDEYEYPASILVNGKNYPGTLATLLEGLYITDYGTKVGDSATYNEEIVVQIYFQVPNIIVTKIVDVVGVSANEKNEILNNGGFQADFKLVNTKNPNDVFTAGVHITQYSNTGALTAESSFKDASNQYVSAEDYDKIFTVSETDSTDVENYLKSTKIETSYDRVNWTESNQVKVENTDGKKIQYIRVTNTYYPRGDLKVTKFVQKESETDADPDPNLEFTFTVDLPEDPIPGTKFPYQIYNGGEIANTTDDTPVDDSVKQLSASERKLNFKLKHNQYIVIENLPVGTVTITEAATAGFVSEFDKPSYSIKAGETESAVCTNTMERTTGTISITKWLFNGSEDDGQTFLFRITGPNDFSMSISLRPDDTKVIRDLPLGVYTITEDTSWSWRYRCTAETAIVDLNDKPNAKAIFTNNLERNKWLNATDVEPNEFKGSSPTNS